MSRLIVNSGLRRAGYSMVLGAALASLLGATRREPTGTDEVTLRRGAMGVTGGVDTARQVDGTILDATPAGLTIASAGEPATTHVIGWQAVSSVRGPLAGRCEPFVPISDALWRVGQRLSRGDLVKAEELAEPLYLQGLEAGTLTGPTGAMIAESAMRCRLARGFNTGAVLAFLDLATIAREPRKTGEVWVGWVRESASEGNRSGFDSILDKDWTLCPSLPPVFSGTTSPRGLRAMVASREWTRLTATPGAIADLAALYRYSATFELGMTASGPGPVGDEPALTSTDPAVVFASQIVLARTGDAAQRAAMRQRLQARLIEQLQRQAAEVTADAQVNGVMLNLSGSWIEAWCRLGLGRSLLREDSAKLRRQGMVELIHLPARFSDSLPELAGLALREVIDALKADGDFATAEVLEGELKTRYPAAAAASEVGGRGASSGAGGVGGAGGVDTAASPKGP